MFDRIPENPGRVKITPESGGAAYYATMERADNPVQEGTPLNKANLLTDETAALFNFEPNAVPDDVLAKLGGSWLERSATYYWTKTEYVAQNAASTTQVVVAATRASATIRVVCSDSIDVTEDLKPIMKNPVTKSWTFSTTDYTTVTKTIKSELSGKYIQNTNNTSVVYKFSNATSGSSAQAGSTITILGYEVSIGSTKNTVSSKDPNAYQEGRFGLVEYVKKPSELSGMARYQMGSYLGTGVSGPNSPNTLTFSFTPSLLVVFHAEPYVVHNYSAGTTPLFLIWGYNKRFQADNGATGINTVEYNGNTVKWYIDNTSYPTYQLNEAGKEYTYLAFG